MDDRIGLGNCLEEIVRFESGQMERYSKHHGLDVPEMLVDETTKMP